jgi:hypothetical protein
VVVGGETGRRAIYAQRCGIESNKSSRPIWAGGITSEEVGDRPRAASRDRLIFVIIFSSAGHWDLSVVGGVLRCEPRSCGQAPPVPVVLGPEENVRVWS